MQTTRFEAPSRGYLGAIAKLAACCLWPALSHGATMIRDTFPEPFLPTDGIHNLRDYGGYEGVDGARVRKGLLYRSGQHRDASEADLDLVQSLDIRTIVDFRGISERTSFPCARHDNFDADVIAFDGETASSPPHEGGGGITEMTPQKAFERMTAVYTRMPVNSAMIEMFARYFKALETREGGSLIHCFAGKDRTGVGASLLLHVLGVHYDDILADFLLTNDAPTQAILANQSLPRMREHYGEIEEEALRNLMGVREEYLATYWSEVTRDHGSVDVFLAQTLGVDDTRKARLRERLLA